jgi:hypothetical protein
MTRRVSVSFALLVAIGMFAATAVASVPGSDVRLTNDVSGGYVSAYTLATGVPYTDAVIDECSIARGRQNEPAIEVDPRDGRVLVGGANDYCGVYAGSPSGGPFVASGPIWTGYYRSENGGQSFRSSLVPGYPGDTSPYAALAKIRTAGSGDTVVTWDSHGRLFAGAESSDDPAGSKKTLGDVWVATYDNPGGVNGNTVNDGKRFVGSTIVARGSSAPNLLGKFNDKTSIQADRTGTACDGVVYFAWSRFSGNKGNNSIYLARSTDHGATWSNPIDISGTSNNVQFPDIAVTSNGHVYVTWRESSQPQRGKNTDSLVYARSTNCGATFAPSTHILTFLRYDAEDVAAPQAIPGPATGSTGGGKKSSGAVSSTPDDQGVQSSAAAPGSAVEDCGDFDAHCRSGYTFFRRNTQVRAASDQADGHEWIYLVYDPSKPGTQVPTGTTYGSIGSGTGSQSAVYFTRLDGTTGGHTTPVLIDNQSAGHQLFPDVSADRGVLHALWWDSRNDPAYSTKRPIGNDAAGKTYASLDVFGARSTDHGATWIAKTKLTDVKSNPNYEQFSNRSVPFAGDYLWVTSLGNFAFGVWTDWRNTVAGSDPRQSAHEDNDGADVKQCRTFDASSNNWSGDQCPHDGGIDQDIYGDLSP